MAEEYVTLRKTTMRDVWSDAAGHGLVDIFFSINNIDPDEEVLVDDSTTKVYQCKMTMRDKIS